MRRLVTVIVHLFALPVGILLSLALVILVPKHASERAIDIALRDTYFVVAHFHVSVLLGCLLAVATGVAYSYRSLNWGLWAAWALFLLHVATALVPWHPPLEPRAEPGTFVTVVPTNQGIGYLYLGSATFGVVAAVVGLITSMVKAWRS
jgi:hypothetical protein